MKCKENLGLLSFAGCVAAISSDLNLRLTDCLVDTNRIFRS